MPKLAIVLALLLVATLARAQEPAQIPPPLKITRALVIADSRARDGQVFRSPGELRDSIALLTLWQIPFDIVRLDTQTLQKSTFVDREGRARYGVILWTARHDLLPHEFKDGEIIRDAVEKSHISLIAFGDRIDNPQVQALLGVHPGEWHQLDASLELSAADHFITCVGHPVPELPDLPCFQGTTKVDVDPTAEVLLQAGPFPLLTARTIDTATGTRAVWIGGDAVRLLSGAQSDLGIRLLQRSLAWTLGAIVYHDFDDSVLLRMDDPGTAQSSYLQGWNYPNLTPEQITRDILAPLRRHSARLSAFCCPGYADPNTKSILHASEVDRVDVFGMRQNVRATFAGLRDAEKTGLIEIQSHGWTHMDPDLETPIPGSTNWWSGTVDGEWKEDRWYREFYDLRRDIPVPAQIQSDHLKKSLDWLENDFGHRPVAFCPPGHAVSGDFFEYDPVMAGTIHVDLAGVKPGATYQVLFGEDEDWTDLGRVSANERGIVDAELPIPPGFWLDATGYLTINKESGGTQFVAGPVRDSLGFDFSLPIRSSVGMNSDEKELFPKAVDVLTEGKVTGRLEPGRYRPAKRPPECTYMAAARAGAGLLLDTSCHLLDKDRVITLKMLASEGFPEDVARALARWSGMPAVLRFHDKDIDENPRYLADALNQFDATGKTVSYVGAEELSAYCHAHAAVRAADDGGIQISLDYHSPFCAMLRGRPSRWTLLADEEIAARLAGDGGGCLAKGEPSPTQMVTVHPEAPTLVHLTITGAGDTAMLNLHAAQ